MDPSTIIALLTEKYAAEKVAQMSSAYLCEEMIKDGLVKNSSDFNLIVLEAVQKALMDDDEFPIHYYTKDEPMSESGRSVGNIECLTDDYIANMLNGG